jgi:hypothetical protein
MRTREKTPVMRRRSLLKSYGKCSGIEREYHTHRFQPRRGKLMPERWHIEVVLLKA